MEPLPQDMALLQEWRPYNQIRIQRQDNDTAKLTMRRELKEVLTILASSDDPSPA